MSIVRRSPRNAHLWLPAYLAGWAERRTLARQYSRPEVILCIADHFEPDHGGVPLDRQRQRARTWLERLPVLCAEFRDQDGTPPQHTFFLPAERYNPEITDLVAELCRLGLGEVEVHLHHDSDTAASLRETLLRFTDTLCHRHGLLRRHSNGLIPFAFVHGNWALDNSGSHGRWCGVNDELTVLKECGCYADFTMPAAPDIAQTRTVNCIYYAIDDPSRPKSHDRGVRVTSGRPGPTDGLLMIQGPLALDWRNRRFGFLPRLDNAALDWRTPPTIHRFERWLRSGVHVLGRPDWLFVKLHSHGAPERNAEMMLGARMSGFHRELSRLASEGRIRLHYVTARECANIVWAAEAGLGGSPSEYRDFVLPRRN